jgi:hypothetical protein
MQFAARRLLLLVLAGLAASQFACKPTVNGTQDTGPVQDQDSGDPSLDAGGDDAGVDAGDAGGRPLHDAGFDAGVNDAGAGNLNFGEACVTDGDCKSGICLSTGVCSVACAGSDACPQNNPSWTCTQDGAHPSVCFCKQTAGGIDICDGQDNDCNGVVDDAATAICPGLNVCKAGGCVCQDGNTCGLSCVDFNSDPQHCGGCGASFACTPGSVCNQGMCACNGSQCADGRGGLVCIDTTSDDQNCGGCGVGFRCLSSQDCSTSTCGPADFEWARWEDRGVSSVYSSDSTCGALDDSKTGLVWQAKPDFNSPKSQADAIATCLAMQACGLTTWRLPTKAELWSTVDFTVNATMNVPAANPAFGIPPGQTQFWTETPVKNVPMKGWYIDFYQGQDGTAPVGTPLFVRCVATK